MVKGSHPLAKCVSAFDSRFGGMFMDTAWRELFCRTEPPAAGKHAAAESITFSGLALGAVHLSE